MPPGPGPERRSGPEPWTGAGVVLRAFEWSDEPDLAEVFADPEIVTWNPGPPEGALAFMRERLGIA